MNQHALNSVDVRDLIEHLVKQEDREVETFILTCEGGQKLLDENPGFIENLWSPVAFLRDRADRLIRPLISEPSNFKHLMSLNGFSSSLKQSNLDLFNKISNLSVDSFTIETPVLYESSSTVRAALESADLSIAAGRPQDAVDRLHTVIHGHLKYICEKKEIEFKKDDTAQHLLSLIRSELIKERGIEQSSPLGKLLGNLSAFIKILGEFRNNKSLSHPNDSLLDTQEAELVVNFAKSALTYLENNFNETKMPQD